MELLVICPICGERCKESEKTCPKCGADFSKNKPYGDASQTSLDITEFGEPINLDLFEE